MTSQDLITAIIKPAFIRLATEDVDVLLSHAVFRSVERISIVTHRRSHKDCCSLVPQPTE